MCDPLLQLAESQSGFKSLRDKYLSELTQHNADLTALEAAEQRTAAVEQQLRSAQVGTGCEQHNNNSTAFLQRVYPPGSFAVVLARRLLQAVWQLCCMLHHTRVASQTNIVWHLSHQLNSAVDCLGE